MEGRVGCRDAGLVGTVVERGPGVRGEDDGRVPERHVPARELVLEVPGVQDLQEEVDGARMRLLDLVEEKEGGRVAGDEVGEQPRLRGLVARREPHEGEVGLVIRERAHVEALVGPLQRVGTQLREIRLSDAGRPREDEERPRALPRDVRLRDDLGVEEPFDEGVDRVVLPEDFLQKGGPEPA